MNKETKVAVKKQQELIQSRLEKATYDKVATGGGGWPFDGIDFTTEPLWVQLKHLEECRSFIRNHDWDEDPSWEDYDDTCTSAMNHIKRVMTPLDWLQGGWYPEVKDVYEYAKAQEFDQLAKQIDMATHIHANAVFEGQCSGAITYDNGKPILQYISLYGSPDVYDSIQFDGTQIVKADYVHNNNIRPELSYKKPIDIPKAEDEQKRPSLKERIETARQKAAEQNKEGNGNHDKTHNNDTRGENK